LEDLYLFHTQVTTQTYKGILNDSLMTA